MWRGVLVEYTLYNGRAAFVTARSTGWTSVYLSVRPLAERATRMHWIDGRRRVKDNLHLIQAWVLLYGWSHFSTSIKASLLMQMFVVWPMMPVKDRTRGVKDP